jgi:copper chaperone CopZ
MVEERLISIPRMSCNGCLKNVTTTLQALPSLTILATDLPTKTLHLCYDPEQLSLQQIRVALEQAEYPIEQEGPLVK